MHPLRHGVLLAAACVAISAGSDVWEVNYIRGDGKPEVSTRFGAKLASKKAIDLDPNITTYARFADTFYPNQNTWHLLSENIDQEVFLAHVLYKNEAGTALDDTSYLQAWRVDPGGDSEWSVLLKRSLSCPSVVLTIPNNGPYVYEARPDTSPGNSQFHQECSCTSQRLENCLRAPQFRYFASNVSASPLKSIYLTTSTGLISSRMYSLQDGVSAPIGVELLRRGTTQVDEVVLFNHSWLSFSSDTWTREKKDAAANSICCDGKGTYLGDSPRVPDLSAESCRAEADPAATNQSRVFGKWVVVKDDYCDVTAQYKSLLLSNAKGMIVITNRTAQPNKDYQVNVYPTEASLMTMPLLVIDSASEIAVQLLEKFSSGVLRVEISDEAVIGVTPGLATVYSIEAGLRVYDTGKGANENNSVGHYKNIFDSAPGGGLVLWMEHSDERSLLFVCIRDEGDPNKSEGRIHIYDTARPMVDVTLVYTVPGDLKCRNNDFHDVHIIDRKVTAAQCPGISGVQMYVTTVLDPNDKNRIYYYDTTDIRSWRMLREIHADWESSTDGLGNVRYTPDGLWHAVTWHCDSRWCGDNYGEKLYWLSSYCPGTPSARTTTPFVTNIPISRGSFAKDIACSSTGICAISMTFDGVALVASNNNSSNQFSLLGSIKQESSYLDELRKFYTFQSNPWLRLFAGAQRIIASKKYDNTWFYEFSTLDGQTLFNSPERDTVVVRSLRKDRIYSFTLSGYEAPAASTSIDPNQKWRFDLKCGSAYPQPGNAREAAECPLTLAAMEKHQKALAAAYPSFIPGWPYHCCSPHYGMCGSGPLFCDCYGCVDYHEVYGMEIPDRHQIIIVDNGSYVPAWPYWILIMLTPCIICFVVHRCISKRLEQRRSQNLTGPPMQDPSYLQGMHLAYVVGNPVEDESVLGNIVTSEERPVNSAPPGEENSNQAELPGSSQSTGDGNTHVVSGTAARSEIARVPSFNSVN
ncbi:hypothetical protein FOL47_008484 [Perkinsus chesapeaki]|uniref:Sorl1p n=1 Tax=Perkinsus chesapeaki TaxID=330153 RepID=A0A7J6LDK8_PERCH|nr:hypothetical protein FOL47_008484 [Perkinsus chesapeaki]